MSRSRTLRALGSVETSAIKRALAEPNALGGRSAETARKLVLRPETLRRLEDGALKRVAGGQPTVQGHHCDSNVHCL